MFYLVHRSLLSALVSSGLHDRLHADVFRPDVALALLAVGVVGLCVEFSAPGRVVPGVIGAACTLLSLISLLATGRGRYGVSLLAVALVLLALGARSKFRLIPSMAAAAVTLAALHVADPGIDSTLAILSSVGFSVLIGFLFSSAALARRAKRQLAPVILKKEHP